MKKFFIITAVMLLVFAGQAAGQTVQFGVRAGLNLSTFDMNDNMQSILGESKTKLGFIGGVTMDVGLTPEFYLLTGLEITQKGYKAVHTFNDNVDLGIIKIPAKAELKMTANPLFVQLPLYFAYKIELADEMKFVPFIGPYLAYGLSGQMKHSASAGILGNSITGNLSDSDLFGDFAFMKNFDYGIGLGAGLDIYQISVRLGYELGLANLSNDVQYITVGSTVLDSDTSIKNRNLLITVGYRF